MYMCKLFQNELPLDEDNDEAAFHGRRFVGSRGRSHSASSVSESSDADDGAVKGSAFFRGSSQEVDAKDGVSSSVRPDNHRAEQSSILGSLFSFSLFQRGSSNKLN